MGERGTGLALFGWGADDVCLSVETYLIDRYLDCLPRRLI